MPHLAGVAGRRFGVWTGNFGRGAYFSNVRYTRAPTPVAEAPVELRTGDDSRLADLRRSRRGGVDARDTSEPVADQMGERPRRDAWDCADQPVPPRADREHSNRQGDRPAAERQYHDREGRRVESGPARTVLESDRDQFARLHFGYSDGVVIYCNGTPLFFGMRAQSFRQPSRDLGVMDLEGDAVYLPLKKGGNEIVFAVTEYSGGWAFWARLDR